MERFDWESPARDRERRCVTVKVGELSEVQYIDSGGIMIENFTLSAFIVADVTMSLRSLLRDKTGNHNEGEQ